jgi:hypothetical protein
MSLYYPDVVTSRPRPPFAGPDTADHYFRAWTESLYVSGAIRPRDRKDRLSDVLNRREPITVVDAFVIPVGAPRAAGLTQREIVLDPLELELVMGGPLHERDTSARAARWIHKVRHPVLIRGRSFEIRGEIHLFPGYSPCFVTYQTGALFMPVTDHLVRRQGRILSGPDSEVVFVNRHAVREIHQLDTFN